MTLRLAFMGTPEFAVPSLSELLANGYEVVRVYTQPPRRAGRGKKLTKSPVHQFAEIMGIPVETPETFRRSSVIDALEVLDVDVACVVAYGQILPQRALDAPKYGCLNLHGSLLPRWRGAAPVQRAIMAGDNETGVQIMQMEKGLDTGDILLSETVSIETKDTAATLSDRLSRIGAGLWPRALGALERGGLTPTPQRGEPTYAHKIDKSEARIDWNRSAKDLDCHIRGLAPFPGAWCEIDGRRVKIHLSEVTNRQLRPVDQPVGFFSIGTGGTIEVVCGPITSDLVRVLELQMEGDVRQSSSEFIEKHLKRQTRNFPNFPELKKYPKFD